MLPTPKLHETLPFRKNNSTSPPRAIDRIPRITATVGGFGSRTFSPSVEVNDALQSVRLAVWRIPARKQAVAALMSTMFSFRVYPAHCAVSPLVENHIVVPGVHIASAS